MARILKRPTYEKPFDVYFVDGRFRVACVCQALLHGHKDSIVILHDFVQQRPWYHQILNVAKKITQVDKMIILKRRDNATNNMIQNMWEKNKYDYKY